MDNPSDCAFLLTKEGQQSLVDLHVDGNLSLPCCLVSGKK